MTFGEKVKAERTKLGMSQDELAAKIGVTRRIIGSYENDKSRPRGMERYKKLAESLNVNVNYLLSEDDAFIAAPKWLDRDKNTLSGKVLALPARDDIDFEIAEHLIVELYSK